MNHIFKFLHWLSGPLRNDKKMRSSSVGIREESDSYRANIFNNRGKVKEEKGLTGIETQKQNEILRRK